MGSSPPVCSLTASLIQVAHVESRCATIIYMNGIENFLLRGREKRHEGVRNGGGTAWRAAREGRREKERGEKRGGECGLSERRGKERKRKKVSASDERGRLQGATERAKIFWHFMSVIT